MARTIQQLESAKNDAWLAFKAATDVHKAAKLHRTFVRAYNRWKAAPEQPKHRKT